MSNFHGNLSTLLFYIERACSPTLEEPNLAFNLEVVDWINQKRANTPREAAMIIVRKVNDRGSSVPMLALSLLDVCVKNCGYPFHLQVSTKEFLNKLVRQFPERPPYRLSRVQTRILQIIAEWNQTLCLTSRYKEDLMNIHDMYRLLQFKGYMFPDIQHDSTSVLTTPDNFRSIEELEEEDRETQSAKLQELVRRGTPADLVEANKLMKILAGYDTGMKNNYRAKVAEDIEKIKKKTILLQEMLKTNGTNTIHQNEIFEDLIISVKNAQPKIQKILDREKNDSEAVSKLLELNDVINSIISQCENNNKKDVLDNKEELKITSKELTAKNDISLIDFEDKSDFQTDLNSKKDEKYDLDDLLGISFHKLPTDIHKTDKKTQDSKPLSLIDESLHNFQNDNDSSILKPLTSESSNKSFPNIQRNSHPNYTKSIPIFDEIPKLQIDEQKNVLNIQALDSPDLVIHFFISYKNTKSNSPITIKIEFSNKSFTDIISSLNFQMAVPKTILLKMEQQDGSMINPSQRNGITQLATVFGVKNISNDLKLKWKVSYNLGNHQMERSGNINYIPSV